MKAIQFLLLASVTLLASCSTRPNITTVDPTTGVKTRYSLGVNVMGETDEVIAHIRGPGGIEVKYAAKREDNTRVPVAGLQAWVSRFLGGVWGRSADLKTVTDGRVALGAQKLELGKAAIEAESAATAGAQANEALQITSQ